MRKTFLILGALALTCGIHARAGDIPGTTSGSPEDFKVEITGSAWLVDSSGTIQSSGTPVDLVTDLGAHQQEPTFYGKLVIKPGRKHRIVVEGTPFRLTGDNVAVRVVTYRGQTFNINETLHSSAELNYLFAGYQYDVISGPAGHLGFSVAGAYLDATGTIHDVERAITASHSQTIGLPLAGAEFRVFPIPGLRWIDIDGGLRGMAFGGYGHYFEAGANGGVWLLNHIGLQAGYRSVNADLHENSSGGSGVDVHLRGPIFSVVWKW
jgi:hypothetical protein